MKTDLRVQKSRKAIEQAFINLVKEKGFMNVSMTEIADKAVVNRNTIYSNYGSKEGIMEAIISGSIEKYFGEMQEAQFNLKAISKKAINETFTNIFKIVSENKELYRILLTDFNSAGYLQIETRQLQYKISKLFKKDNILESKLSFLFNGIWGVVSNYIINEKGKEEEYIKALTELTIASIRHIS